MSKLFRPLISSLLLASVGCVPANRGSGPLLGAVAGVQGAPGGAPPSAVSGKSGSGAEDPSSKPSRAPKGAIGFWILWPERHVQAIPTEANSIFISVEASGSQIASALIERPDSTSAMPASGSIPLDPAGGLTVVARAYAAKSPNLATDPILASAVVKDVQVTGGEDTQITMTLEAAASPVLAAAIPPNAGPGATASVVGTGLGPGLGLPFDIVLVSSGSTFDINAGAVGSSSGGQDKIVFQLPTTVLSGKIVVTANGKPSNALPFTVIGMLKLTPASPTVNVGNHLQFTLEASNSPEVGGMQSVLASPSVEWLLTGSSSTASTPVATISATGLLSALAPGTASVVVRSGNASASAEVTVP